MRGFWSIYRKELILYFYSPLAYTLAFIFLLITGYFFAHAVFVFSQLSMQMMNYSQMEGSLNISEIVLIPMFHNINVVLLFIIPLLTMRLFAEEKRLGTGELLFTYPVSDAKVTMAKYLACLTVYACIFLPTILHQVILAFISDPEIGPILTSYLGFLLLGCACIALGTCISSLVESQLVAATLTFGAILALWLLDWLTALVPPNLQGIVGAFSYIKHFESFPKGVLDTRDIIYYILFSILFIFLTLRSLESKRWRG